MVRHVLLVEAAANLAGAGSLLSGLLRQRGYLVQIVREGTAQGWACHCRPDLVVLAGCPPGPEDVCRSLKLQRATNALPVVQVHGGELPVCLRVEPEAVLSEPVTPAALGAAIDRALAVRAERQRERILDEVNLWLPSDPAELEALGQMLPGWLTSCGLTPFGVQQFNLAVREVVANAIEWGHRYERSLLVSVLCRLDAEKVSILVRDCGPGFDRRDLPHAARPGDPLSHLEVRARRKLREGGFGILLASGLVDHLCYNDTGNESLLIKFLPGRAFRSRTRQVDPRPAPVGT
jgi:anti-sigma regulatory factor (Ser/Thr protein kinase)